MNICLEKKSEKNRKILPTQTFPDTYKQTPKKVLVYILKSKWKNEYVIKSLIWYYAEMFERKYQF